MSSSEHNHKWENVAYDHLKVHDAPGTLILTTRLIQQCETCGEVQELVLGGHQYFLEAEAGSNVKL